MEQIEIKKDKQYLVHFNNDIYDLSKFIEKHPGGVNTLKGFNNGDMTKRFFNGPPHSKAAFYLMKEYKINNDKNFKLSKLNDSFDHQTEVKNTEIIKRKNNIETSEIINTDKENIENGEDLINNNIDQLTDESMEHLVDWSKAMLPQIHKIKTVYNDWVNKPVDRPLKLFESWYLEICTKTPWWVIPLFWIPIIIYLFLNEANLKIWSSNIFYKNTTILLYFIYGTIIWTFVEYSLHRWVFHMNMSKPKSWQCTFHFLLHGLHHKVPFDPYRLVFPPIPAFILATIFYPFVYLLSTYPQITMSGGLFGYLCYDMMHYYLHYGNPRLWHMYQMKRYHYQHHFAHHDRGFGISSPLWDFIFDTRIYLRKLKYILQWKL